MKKNTMTLGRLLMMDGILDNIFSIIFFQKKQMKAFSAALAFLFLAGLPFTVFSQLTNPSACQLGQGIGDDNCPAGTSFFIDVTTAPGTTLGDDVAVTDVNIIVAHTWVGDLRITLTSPSGVEVSLSFGNGDDDDNYGDPSDGTCTAVTNFNMNAANGSIAGGIAPFIGSYIPEGDFNDFNDGSSPIGLWELRICDGFPADVGSLEFVEIIFGDPPFTGECLSTLFGAELVRRGYMFDVVNIGTNPLEIEYFEANYSFPSLFNVDVYHTTAAETFVGKENNPGAWTLLGSAMVNSPGGITPINIGGLVLAPGERRGIYISSTQPLMTASPGTGFYDDGKLFIDTDPSIGLPTLFGTPTEPMQWNGGICYTEIAVEATYSVAPDDADKNEGDAGPTPFTFTVTRAGDLSFPGQVVFALDNPVYMNPAAAIDFDGFQLATLIEFAPGESQKTATINVAGDTKMEADEIFNVLIFNALNGEIITPTAEGIIRNDDNAGANNCLETLVAAGNLAIGTMFDIHNDGADDLTIESFELALSGAGQEDIEIYFTTTADTYLGNQFNGGAWTLLGAETVTIAPGGFTNPTPVNIGGLTLAPGESKGLYVTTLSGSIAVSNGTSMHTDGTLNIDLDAGLSLSYPFGAGPGGVFLPRQFNGSICYSTGPSMSTSLSIAADDADKDEGSQQGGSTPFTFTVTRTGDLSGSTDVDYEVPVTGGFTPANGADFIGGVRPSGTVSFSPSENTKTITIPVAPDFFNEFDENFSVKIMNPTNGAAIIVDQADGIIRNDDVVGVSDCLATIESSVGEAVNGAMFDIENQGSATIVITSFNAYLQPGDHTVQVYTTHTATTFLGNENNAGAWTLRGTDSFFGLPPTPNPVGVDVGPITLAPGEKRGVYITSVNNTMICSAGTGSYTHAQQLALDLDPGVSVAHPFGGATSPRQWHGSVCFYTVGSPLISIEEDNSIEFEGDNGATPFTFSVTRTQVTSGTNAVDFTVSGSGSPASPNDFVGGVFPSGTLVFSPGETEKTLTIDVQGDTNVENDEGFVVTLSNPTNGANLQTHFALGEILDDDCTTVWYADFDEDGFGDPFDTQVSCDQPNGYVSNDDDCDDFDENVNPNAAEICNGIDDDCDGQVDEGTSPSTWYADNDGDGFGDAGNTTTACAQPAGHVENAGDCDDTNGNIHPNAAEICNGVDDDCDGEIDEHLGQTWYADADGDSYGDPGDIVMACDQPAGYVANDGDCDDTNGDIHPAAAEICNGIDDDCDGQIDEGLGQAWYADTDGDSYGDPVDMVTACDQPAGYVANDEDCDDTNGNVHPAANELCNGVDDDCDGEIDEDIVFTMWYADADADGFGNPNDALSACAQPAGYVANDEDCDDTNENIHPNATEICNGVDDDCNGQIDEGLGQTWYADADGDSYGDPADMITACAQPAGYVANADDCDDTNGNIHPAAAEICNGVDDDCDGQIDEDLGQTWYADADGDGFGDPATSVFSCETPAGHVANADDCDDTNGNIHPAAAEICNGLDDDCDGETDEGCGCTITAIAVANISGCDDNGTSDPADDTFMADVTVTFSNPPTTGTLDLSGDGTASEQVANLGTGSHTFAGVVMSADGSAISLTAVFSADPACVFSENNAGVAPSPCSGNCSVEIVEIIATAETCPGAGNGSIEIVASGTGQIGYSIDGGASFQFTNTFEQLSPGTYPIVVQVFGSPSCSATGSAVVAPGSPANLQVWYKDWDGDGHSDGITQTACEQPSGYFLAADLTATSGDCNDQDANEHPGQTWWLDADDDGWSDGTWLTQCTRPAGHKMASELSGTATDCDDTNPNIHPAAAEICNGIDDDCDGEIDEGTTGGLTWNGNVFFNNQTQVDDFSQCYSVINGSLTIQNSLVIDLSNLINLVEVTGNVTIKNTGLTDMNGLDNLATMGGTLLVRQNNSLTNLDGLEGVTSVGANLTVTRNVNLSDCCAIHDLMNNGGVLGSISISRNDTGCDNISEVNTNCVGGSALIAPTGGNGVATSSIQAADFQSVELFPNPVSEVLNIRFAKGFEQGTLQLFDLRGKLLSFHELSGGEVQTRLSVGHLEPGIYLIHVLVDGERFTERVMVD